MYRRDRQSEVVTCFNYSFDWDKQSEVFKFTDMTLAPSYTLKRFLYLRWKPIHSAQRVPLNVFSLHHFHAGRMFNAFEFYIMQFCKTSYTLLLESAGFYFVLQQVIFLSCFVYLFFPSYHALFHSFISERDRILL